MCAKVMNNDETIRFFRACVKRKDLHIIGRRRTDRRLAFFSYVSNCRRKNNSDRRSYL